MNHRLFRLVLGALLYAIVAGGACAQAWPARPVKFILPFAAGGSGDTFARPLAIALGESLGQQFLIENIAGAAAMVGTQTAARAAPDGYTFLMVSNAHTINETLQPKLGYVLFKDFVPVTGLANLSLVLVVHPSLKATTLKEFIALAKAEPGKLNYASAGTGSIYHLPMELLSSMAGISLVHVPYKASSGARTDVLGGQVPIMMDALAVMQPFIAAQKVTALGISSARRNVAAPNLPTIAETLPGFEGDAWLGFMAPAGTPPAIVERLNAEIVKFLARPQVRTAYTDMAAEPVGNTPAEFGQFLKAEVDKWGKVITVSGTKP